jgi:ABC-type transporter lipoprotein component MlaA
VRNAGLSVPIFCSSTLRDYFGLIFDELFTVFDSRGEFSRLNVFFISTVKKLLQEV